MKKNENRVPEKNRRVEASGVTCEEGERRVRGRRVDAHKQNWLLLLRYSYKIVNSES